MDKNTLTAMLLMGLLLLGFMYISKPSEEQIEAQQKQLAAEHQQQQQLLQQEENQYNASPEEFATSDSAKLAETQSRFGVFAEASLGEETTNKIETELLNVEFSNKGGRISSVELKNYKTHDKKPLYLFDSKKEGLYNFTLITANNRVLNTADLYFNLLPVVKTDSTQIVTMRLNAGENSYMDFVYTIPNNDYRVAFDIVANNMENVLSSNFRDLELLWTGMLRQQEKGRDFENRYSTIYYKFQGDDNVEYLSETKSENKRLPSRLKWVAFKNQFFSTVLIADEYLNAPELETNLIEDTSSPYLKECLVKTSVPFNLSETNKTAFKFYFGPNHYKTLRDYDKGLDKADKLDLEKLVPLGWALFRWINQVLVIPMFNFFGKYLTNYGIIILLMTFVIKMLIFPLTFKSYMSSARMRVLKPEIEKINEKIPASKPQDRQRATMELYRQAGVNPMGGCLPMLLQMPILIALFAFFPSSIELRQQSFLWADDLSSYDSILDLPFDIPFYGAHVSLFCLLMTIVNIIYTRINMATQDTGSQQMPGMKTMMYLMPLMFLFFFNGYASGLSYYYLVSLLITIAQTYAIRASVNEEKLLAQLMENKKKPQKKSGFMARLEEAQKMQQKQLEQKKKKK
jgi:YidC/Oxa1 family membrane protein insertase